MNSFIERSVRLLKRDFDNVLTSSQIEHGIQFCKDCLQEVLIPLKKYALPAIGSTVAETLSEIRLLRTEELERFNYLKGELWEIKSRITPVRHEVTPGFFVPFPRNDKFVGHENNPNQLYEALQSGETVGVHPAMLSGMGRLAKSNWPWNTFTSIKSVIRAVCIGLTPPKIGSLKLPAWRNLSGYIRIKKTKTTA